MALPQSKMPVGDQEPQWIVLKAGANGGLLEAEGTKFSLHRNLHLTDMIQDPACV